MTATDALYSTDAYLKTFEAGVIAVDDDAHRVALSRTAFYPGGGGQPHDLGVLRWDGGQADVASVRTEGPSSGTPSRTTLPCQILPARSRGPSTGSAATC